MINFDEIYTKHRPVPQTDFIGYNKKSIFNALKDRGVTRVVWEYSGCGGERHATKFQVYPPAQTSRCDKKSHF